MDSTGDAAPADELRELTRQLCTQLRTQLRRHVALGAWAAPGGPTAEHVGAAAAAADDAVADAGLGADAAAAAAAATAGDAADIAPAVHAPASSAPAAVGDGDEPADRFAADDPAIPHAAYAEGNGFDGFAPAREAPAVAAAEPFAPREWHDSAEQGEILVPLGRRTLAQVREELGECTRCKLHTTRRKIVFGVGAEDAPLMFVGEAPGEQEDKRGEPFVGPAGELLDKMIEAMGWTRQTVFIANTLKCRPPGNRNPQPDELEQCTPFLDAQIRAIAPRIIVTLGRPAANHVLRKDAPISSLRGRFHDRAGVKVMPTFHPAYLLREPERKKDTWSDLKLVIAELERLGIKPPRPPRG
jgi:DNA polymerase